MPSERLTVAVESWLGAMHHLLAPHFKTTTNRIEFVLFDNEWNPVTTDVAPCGPVSLEDGYFKHRDSDRLFSAAYPLLVLSEITLSTDYDRPFYRLIDEHGVMLPTGTMLLDRALLACLPQSLELLEVLLIEPTISDTEALLLRERLMADISNYPPDHPPLAAIETLGQQYGMPPFDHGTLYKYVGKATTHTKGIKNIIAYLEQEQPDNYDTCCALIKLRGPLDRVARQRVANLVPFFERLRAVLKTSTHPMVKDLYLVALNKCASLMFEECLDKKPEPCLKFVSELVDESVNLDINLARKSMIEQALGLEQEAESTWAQLMGLQPDREVRLPGVFFHSDVFGAEEWRTNTAASLQGKGVSN